MASKKSVSVSCTNSASECLSTTIRSCRTMSSTGHRKLPTGEPDRCRPMCSDLAALPAALATGGPAVHLRRIQQQLPIYDEYKEQPMYGAISSQMSQQSLFTSGTPSRSKLRPSPVLLSTGNGEGISHAKNSNIPTRCRSISTGRNNLPPPPPILKGIQSPSHLANGAKSRG